ncbi:MAG: Hpt domain-containing protein [Pseudobacteriovorax sp.]|nr:Hpt domain-containing protein [Pseudobacteriovorax sp.]
MIPLSSRKWIDVRERDTKLYDKKNYLTSLLSLLTVLLVLSASIWQGWVSLLLYLAGLACLSGFIYQSLVEALRSALKPYSSIDISKYQLPSLIAYARRTYEDLVSKQRMAAQAFGHLKVGYLTLGPGLKTQDADLTELGLEPTGALEDYFTQGLFPFFLLAEREKEAINFHLNSTFGLSKVQWRIAKVQFPKTIKIRLEGKGNVSLHTAFQPQFVDGKLETITVIFQDVSDYETVKEQAFHREQEMERLFSLLKVSDSLFELFMDETRLLFDEIKSDLKMLKNCSEEEVTDVSQRMFRNVHTIKANARLFKLSTIEEVAHHVESSIADVREKRKAFTPDAVQDIQIQVMRISEEIYSYASLRKEISNSFSGKRDKNLRYRVQWIKSLVNQFSFVLRDPEFEPRHLKGIQKEFGRALSSFEKTSMRDYLRDYNEMLQDFASKLGKKIAPIQTDFDVEYFDGIVLTRINDILLHCLRNSIDHGIESPEERKQNNKDPLGVISIKTTEKSGIFEVMISDDGKGLDLEGIKSQAQSKGLLDSSKEYSEQDLCDLVFTTGFSSSDNVSLISGRGFGMSSIADTARHLHGTVNMRSKPGLGSDVILRFPANSEENLSPFTIYDLNASLQLVLKEFSAIHPSMHSKLSAHQSYVFGDRWAFYDVARKVLGELVNQLHENIQFTTRVEACRGRRRVDSYTFYRILLDFTFTDGESLRESETLSMLAKRLERAAGSLILRSPTRLEINIPSNIPVPFSQYEFTIVSFCDKSKDVIPKVAEYFENVMSGWKYRVLLGSEISTETASELNGPIIGILDASGIEAYTKWRDDDARLHDGILFITDDEQGIERLGDSEILPENIVFTPAYLQSTGLNRGLTGVVLRRFLKEMVRSQDSLSERDLDIIGNLAG